MVVPFVGAGLSLYGDADERLPMWRELLERLVDEGIRLGLIGPGGDDAVTTALDERRYIEATDRILELLGEPTFRRAVARELDDTGHDIPPAIGELVAIGWSLIVTTNLDRFINRAYVQREGEPLDAFTSTDTRRLAAALAGNVTGSTPALAKLHGDIDDYPSWRLTGSHYRQLLQDPGYVEALKHLFLRQVFFVGFGLQDDDFDYILDTIAHIYPAGVGEFYALLSRDRQSDPAIQRLIRVNGLRPIYYDVAARVPDDPFGGHHQVFQCLEHLSTAWAEVTVNLPIRMKYFPDLDPNFVGRADSVAAIRSCLLEKRLPNVQLIALGGMGKTSLAQQFIETSRLDIARAGFEQIFGASFYRADIGEFIHDLELSLVGPSNGTLPHKVDRICAHLRAHRVLLVLDGLENVLSDQGLLSNPYLVEVIAASSRGGGAALITSRIAGESAALTGGVSLDLAPFSEDQIADFLDQWDLLRLPTRMRRRLFEITGGHPLALRVLCGVLANVDTEDAVQTLDESPVLDVGDELDPLRENRLARIIGSYLPHLSKPELAFMQAWTAFDRPVHFGLVDETLSRDYVEPCINSDIAGEDLRPIVNQLMQRRLLAVGVNGELSSHPTVREFFATRAAQEGQSPIEPIHRYLAGRFAEQAVDEPGTVAEMVPLLSACRHAARTRDWSMFDTLFRDRAMRGFRNFLCDNLGAWDECLDLARLGDDPHHLSQMQDPAYYPMTVARSLKHLGRSTEARAAYLRGLDIARQSRDPESAKYINTLLTLLIWRGELRGAEALVELNVGALDWIEDDWRRRWQIEHGFSSIAYLRLLQGAPDQAEALFEVSESAWDGYEGERVWVYDNYPYWRSELFLDRTDPDFDRAISVVDDLLLIARQHDWPESICRGLIHRADIHRSAAGGKPDPLPDLVSAESDLRRARELRAGVAVPDVEIALILAEARLELDRRLVGAPGVDSTVLESRMDLAENLAAAGGLYLAAPDLLAARGALSLLRGDRDGAETAHLNAISLCEAQGNRLAARSPRFAVGGSANTSALPRLRRLTSWD